MTRRFFSCSGFSAKHHNHRNHTGGSPTLISINRKRNTRITITHDSNMPRKPSSANYCPRPVMPMPNPRRPGFTATFIFLLALPACAEGGNPALGQRLAQEWCAKCHAIGIAAQARFKWRRRSARCIYTIMWKILRNPLPKAFWSDTRRCLFFASIRIKSQI